MNSPDGGVFRGNSVNFASRCTFIVGGWGGAGRLTEKRRRSVLKGSLQCRASAAKTMIERTTRFSTSGLCSCLRGCAKTSSPISSPCCRIGPTPKTCFSRPAWCCGASSASFSRESNFLAWACRVAFFEVRNFQRVASRDRLRFSDAVLAELAEHRVISPENANRKREFLLDCIAKLSDDQRTLLLRTYEDEKTIRQLADELDRHRRPSTTG